MIKVVLTGSECTGKTELACTLGEWFRAPISAEFVREYVERHPGKLDFDDHGPIARGQMASEDAAIARASELVILDTDLVSTAVYCEHYFGSCPVWIYAEARARAGDLYLLLATDIPWIADGVRDRGHFRDEVQDLFRRKLQEMNLHYVEISGGRQQRLDTATAAIRQVLGRAG